MMQTLVEKLENVKAEMDGHVLVVTMNRPKALNALNNQTLDELQAVFDMAAQDADIYGVIITGEGRGFVAGADIVQRHDASGGHNIPPTKRGGL